MILTAETMLVQCLLYLAQVNSPLLSASGFAEEKEKKKKKKKDKDKDKSAAAESGETTK